MPKGYLQLVLHAHLPYVRHPEYDRFLEERWLFEAVTETYIPLIKFFDQLRDENTPFKLTLSISPTLANMLEDPLLRERCVRHLDLSIGLAEKECERTRHWQDVNSLSWMYKRLFEEARHTFVERCGTRLISAFKEYADAGNLELITCAGTHGFLPLLSSEPSSVRAQVFTAVHEHERIFGKKPKGMWVPERAYYPDIGFDLDQHYLEPFQYAQGIRTHTGIKYHRITGKTQDKHLYNPDWASQTAERHAHDFVNRCRDQAVRAGSHMPFPATIVSPYDAELFGHWRFEGPPWI